MSIESQDRANPARSSVIDVQRERQRTRGATHSHHLNAAGSALPTHEVVERVRTHLDLEERIGGYEAATQMADELDGVYRAAAGLVGGTPDEIALFDSASTGLRVLFDALDLAPGARVVASSTSYVSHALHILQTGRRRDLDVRIAPVDASGRVDVAALDALLDDGAPSVVTVSHIPTSSGLIEPVSAIGAVAGRHGATFVVDATQSVGQLEVDVDAIGCDILVTTGRKFLRGPRGTGFAYVRRSLLERTPPTAPDVRGAEWIAADDWCLASTARRYETWEGSVAGRLGLGVAVREAGQRGMRETERWLQARGRLVREQLAGVPGIVLAEPRDEGSAIVTFTVEGLPALRMVEALRLHRIRVVQVPASHAQWDLGARGLDAVVRASMHVYNDDADIDTFVSAVAAVVKAER